MIYVESKKKYSLRRIICLHYSITIERTVYINRPEISGFILLKKNCCYS